MISNGPKSCKVVRLVPTSSSSPFSPSFSTPPFTFLLFLDHEFNLNFPVLPAFVVFGVIGTSLRSGLSVSTFSEALWRRKDCMACIRTIRLASSSSRALLGGPRDVKNVNLGSEFGFCIAEFLFRLLFAFGLVERSRSSGMAIIVSVMFFYFTRLFGSGFKSLSGFLIKNGKEGVQARIKGFLGTLIVAVERRRDVVGANPE
jgi:hypothetical protein